jgi:hypothetical protein
MAPASITSLPSTTNLNNVNFNVTFSEPVLGIDAEDFAFDSTNTTVGGASITGVTTTDNTVYTVAVNTGTGNGTIQLNYHDDTDVTVDGNNIPLNGSAAVTPLTIPGPTYNVVKVRRDFSGARSPEPSLGLVRLDGDRDFLCHVDSHHRWHCRIWCNRQLYSGRECCRLSDHGRQWRCHIFDL